MEFEFILYSQASFWKEFDAYKSFAIPMKGDKVRLNGDEWEVVERIFRAGSNIIELYVRFDGKA